MKHKWWNLCEIFVSCNSYISVSIKCRCWKTGRTVLQSVLRVGEVISVWCDCICPPWCEKTSLESILKYWLVKSRWHNELIASVLQHGKLAAYEKWVKGKKQVVSGIPKELLHSGSFITANLTQRLIISESLILFLFCFGYVTDTKGSEYQMLLIQ